MAYLFLVLIIITCAVIAFFVLIQNPKGGGLSGEFGGMGTQLMGAKQSTDVVEKGTWVAAAVLVVLVLGSFIMAEKPTNSSNEKSAAEKALKGQQIAPPVAPTPNASAPVQTATAPAEGATAPSESTTPAPEATTAPAQTTPAPAESAPATK